MPLTTAPHADADIARIVLDATGDAGQLRYERAPLAPPGPGEVRVRHTRIGVNYVDIYHRSGRYPLPALPVVPGVEAVGRVEALGAGVHGLRPGQRVAYAGPPVGAYSEARNVAAAHLCPLPDDIDDDTAAALLLRGITAHMLFAYVRPLRAGETVLVQAAAGGLGLVLVQWAKALGATVIGTVGSPEKAALARVMGLDHAIEYRQAPVAASVQALTSGRGVDFAIDGIGGPTLIDSLGMVAAYGMAASIGQVSGEPGPIDPEWLGPARSIALARPGVFRFMRDPKRYREGVAATFERVRGGLRAVVDDVLPLAQAAEAQRRLESGRSAGALLLRP